MFQWFICRGKKTRPSRWTPRKPARLALEWLEDRCLPSGATITVNTTADEINNPLTLSLREAVEVSQTGDTSGLSTEEQTQISGNPMGGDNTINFSTGLNGTINLAAMGALNGAIALNQNVTIAGPGASQLEVSGGGVTRILNNGTAGISLTITGLTIQGGSFGGAGGAILNNGILTLTDAIFLNNVSTSGGGGAIANVLAGSTLIVTGTTFTGNSALVSGGGGAIFSPGAGISMTITNSSFTNNSAADAGAGGGAIFSANAGSPITITNSAFTGNSAVGTGGAIFSPGASKLTLINSDFTSNTALDGGAVAATGSADETISITDSRFSSNSAIGGSILGGGALVINGNTSSVTISGSSFSQNLSDLRGGAISSAANTGFTSINMSTFSENMADGDAVTGGAIFDSSSTQLAITNSSFTDNSATGTATGHGGALYLDTTGAIFATLANLSISGNTATTAGGGVFANGETIAAVNNSNIFNNTAANGGGLGTAGTVGSVLTLSASTVSGNTATNSGGGVHNTAKLNLFSSTVSGNTASTGDGGGIYSNSTLDDPLAVVNSTLANNIAALGDGGGIFSQDGEVLLTNSTIAFNEADGGGGLWAATAGGVTLNNTIVAQNTQTDGTTASDLGGSNVVATSMNNLIGTGGSGGLIDGTNNNQVGIANPGLNPLGNYGGPTQTVSLQQTSAAVDSGDTALAVFPGGAAILFDQRGFDRVDGASVDIGAVELDRIAPMLLSFTRQNPASSPTSANALVFRVTFDEDVIGVDAGDFFVNGATTATVTGVTGSGSVYDVTVSGGNLAGFNGVVGLDLSGTPTITDLAGNALPAGEPATDETYVVENVAAGSLAESLASNQAFIIVGATGSPTSILSVKIFDSTGNLVSTVTPFNNPTSLRVAVGDFDGDGSQDEFAVLGRRTNSDLRAEIITYDLSDAGQATETSRFFAFAPGILGNGFIAAGDFDGDGDDDLAVAQIGGGRTVVTLQLHVSDGAGTFAAGGSTVINFGIISAPRIGAGDIDGDGSDEIIIAARTPEGARVLPFDADDPTQTPVQQGTGFFWDFGVAGYARGAFVAVGEFDQNFAGEELVLGSNIGGGGRVDIVSYDGAGAATLVENGRLNPFGDTYNAAVRVAVGQLDDRMVLVAGQDRFQAGQYTIMARLANTGQTNPPFEQIPAITALTLDDGLAPPTSPDGNRTLGPFIDFANLTNVIALLAPTAPENLFDGDPEDFDLVLATFDEETAFELTG